MKNKSLIVEPETSPLGSLKPLDQWIDHAMHKVIDLQNFNIFPYTSEERRIGIEKLKDMGYKVEVEGKQGNSLKVSHN